MTDGDISYPGRGWRLRWLDGPILGHLELDIVGFLAILGEDAVKSTSKLASLSWLFCLPRLLPAPHSLLWAERPEEYEVVRAKVSGVYSGNHRNELTSVTAALFSPLPKYNVGCFRVAKKPEADAGSSRLRATYKGPVIIVNIFGCALSIALLIVSLIYGDGFSLLSTVLLSALSTLVGITNHWTWKLGGVESKGTPRGDSVIRYPNGSFLVIKCDESVARELFFPQTTVHYTLRWANGFIFISLLGTVLLMVSVIALANARIELQLAWAGAYILLNIGHWVAAALPKKYNWDFSAYVLHEEQLAGGGANANYTHALWKAIVLARSANWARGNDTVPSTSVWAEWLDEAEEQVRKASEPSWEAENRVSSFHRPGVVALRDVTWNVPDWDPKKHWDAVNESFDRSSTERLDAADKAERGPPRE